VLLTQDLQYVSWGIHYPLELHQGFKSLDERYDFSHDLNILFEPCVTYKPLLKVQNLIDINLELVRIQYFQIVSEVKTKRSGVCNITCDFLFRTRQTINASRRLAKLVSLAVFGS
jgi:hypothetical protein